MRKSLYDYADYKAYLKDRIDSKGRGEMSRIADALRCHVGYVSQVVRGDADFSLEQADFLNLHLGHSEDEQEFFLLLVGKARAGTDSLRKRYISRIKKCLQERLVLENRLKQKKVLPLDSQAIYYSAWYYAAIHVLLTIPAFQTKEAIAKRLQLPPALVSKALDFLLATGSAEQAQGRFRTGQVSLHLTNDSPWIARHHSSWRLRAAQATDRSTGDEFHYTSVISMAESDAPAVRKILIEAIEQVRAVVRKSPEEALYCYSLDFFGA